MKRLVLALAVAGCASDTTPRWQLDHDRIVAIRANPPGLLPGEVGTLEALLAHVGDAATVEPPRGATAAFAPGDLFTAVHFNLDHWEIDGPDEARLDVARAELGLPAGAPVPLEVSLQFTGPLYATKVVMLGESRANPALPPVRFDGVPAGTELAVDAEAELLIEAAPDLAVRWLTSCGTLDDDDVNAARLVVDEACDGELAVVVRDGRGGASWQVWPLHAR